MSKGCKQVPLDYTCGIVRWAHPDGYFLNAQGQKIAHNYSPAQIRGMKTETYSGSCYPNLSPEHKQCHLLMAIAYYGPRPDEAEIGVTKKRSSYVCHHLIPDKLDYRPANLLCWLTREQHNEADRRQRALSKVIGDLHSWPYEKLREYQDPRVMTSEEFDIFIERISKRKEADNAKNNL